MRPLWNGHRIEKAVGNDLSRPALNHVYLDVDASMLYATDSYVMVGIPVQTDDGETSGTVPVDAIKASRKFSAGNAHCTDEGVTVSGYAKYERATVEQQPPSFGTLKPEAEPVVTVGFTADVLIRALEALGARRVELAFYASEDPERPPHVRPVTLRDTAVDGAYAVVMPVRLPGASTT